MSEKRFYRLALEGSLLDGRNVKKRIDAKIAASAQQSGKRARQIGSEWNPRPIPMIAVPATVFLVLCTLTVALFGSWANRSGRQTVAGDSTPTAQETVLSSPLTVENEPSSVLLLSEFDSALQQECLDWRASQTREPYDESKWTWLRECRLETTEVYESGGRLHWRIEFAPSKLQPFLADDMNQRLDFALWKAWYSVEGDAGVYSLGDVFHSGGYQFNEAQGTLREGWYTADALQSFPASGKVTVTVQYCIVDCSVEDMARYFGSVAIVQQSFSFDAEKLQNDSRTLHQAVALSGEYTFSIPNADRSAFSNRSLCLDGAVLDAAVRRTDDGMVVWFTVAEAPENWTADEKQAVLVSLLLGRQDRGRPTYRQGDAEAVSVYMSHTPFLWTDEPTTPEMWISCENVEADPVQLDLNVNWIASVNVYGKQYQDGWTTEMLEDQASGIAWETAPLCTVTLSLP